MTQDDYYNLLMQAYIQHGKCNSEITKSCLELALSAKPWINKKT